MADAGTVTLTRDHSNTAYPRREVIDWTSDASGNAEKSVGPLYGVILRVVFNPDGGDDAPSDNYDVVLNDADGVDVLSGLGGNRHTSTTQEIVPLINGSDGTNTTPVPRAVAGNLTLSVSNAGAANGGQVVLYLR